MPDCRLPKNSRSHFRKDLRFLKTSDVQKVIKEMRDKRATGDGLNLLIQLINNIYESGEWPKDFTSVTMVVLKKKPKARKCRSSHIQPLCTGGEGSGKCN
jgi:hypothetical protein